MSNFRRCRQVLLMAVVVVVAAGVPRAWAHARWAGPTPRTPDAGIKTVRGATVRLRQPPPLTHTHTYTHTHAHVAH
jgi:hypothetical protein